MTRVTSGSGGVTEQNGTTNSLGDSNRTRVTAVGQEGLVTLVKAEWDGKVPTSLWVTAIGQKQPMVWGK